MLRPIASRLTNVTTTGAVLNRNYTNVVIGPATKHISRGEKYALAGTMVVCLLATPAYILTNLKHYKAKK